MDANYKKKRRDRRTSRGREERWSMDAQRFEVILTQIRDAYNNIRKNFDQVDLPEILEEVVTEYALEAMREDADGDGPGFTELAVLLQHCSELYGKKVDFLYQNVLDLRDSFSEARRRGAEPEGGDGDAEPGARRRGRAAPAGAPFDFAPVELARCPAARREAGALRPPPTLPRMYLELEPRPLDPGDRPLADLAGEPVGLLQDYYLCGRLHAGALVGELEPLAGAAAGELKALSLEALAAALAAGGAPLAASTPLPAAPEDDSGIVADAPSPAPAPAPAPAAPPRTPDARRKRKRSPDGDDEPDLTLRLVVTDELSEYLSSPREFSLPERWVARVVSQRARALLHTRESITEDTEFRGFETSPSPEEFAGWDEAEAEAALAVAGAMRANAAGGAGGGAVAAEDAAEDAAERAAERAAWSAGVAARALRHERGEDAQRLVARVRARLRDVVELGFQQLLRLEARDAADVSWLLLAALLLASNGEITIEQSEGDRCVSFVMRPTPLLGCTPTSMLALQLQEQLDNA